jgi:hypothetical protein
MKKKKRKFSKEAWEKMMSTVKPEEPKEEKKEDAKVEVHIHNNVPVPEFNHKQNGADFDLERLMGNNRGRWIP